MSKVLKIFLYTGFTPIQTDTLKLGTRLDFDCYVQRFNGFVIIIEKGTILDKTIHQKILNNNLPIYVQTKSYSMYKQYTLNHNSEIEFSKVSLSALDLNEQIKNALDIKKSILKTSLPHERLQIVYTHAKNILNAWIALDIKKNIPIEALNYLVEILIEIISKEEITFSKFNRFFDTHDSLAAHSVKVCFFAALIGHELGIDLEDQRKLTFSALLHDVGKCEVDESLFLKPDVLSEHEYQMIKLHSEASVALVRRSGIKDRHILAAIKDHHERLDGSGYPDGLRENRISTFGKIIAVCDAFDSLITIKTYRGAYTTFNALSLMRKESKQKFDIKFINILIKLLA